jgi:hypothetical protein
MASQRHSAWRRGRVNGRVSCLIRSSDAIRLYTARQMPCCCMSRGHKSHAAEFLSFLSQRTVTQRERLSRPQQPHLTHHAVVPDQQPDE